MINSANSYIALAFSVVRQAYEDFKPTAPLPSTHISRADLERALDNVRTRISGGEFLIERNDAVVQLWFGLTTLSQADFARFAPVLAELRAIEMIFARRYRAAVAQDVRFAPRVRR